MQDTAKLGCLPTFDDMHNLCAVYVDMGTTNTRVWLAHGDHILARSNQAIGIRDAARGERGKLRAALRDLIAGVQDQTPASCAAAYVAAAGMITSALGLIELPHIQSPAGLQELAMAASWHHFSDISDLPVLLVPGLRSGAADPTLDSIHEADVMRGEETLCAGLVALRLVQPPAVVINLGSHWKAVQIGQNGKIESSITTVSGELIHTAQQHTILASSVSSGQPGDLTMDWIDAGMREQRRSGLARALFCVRLLHLANEGTANDRFAFLGGAFIASDLDAFVSRSVLKAGRPAVLVGNPAVVQAWKGALSQAGIAATVITPTQVESALLKALQHILLAAVPKLQSVSHKVVSE